MDISRVKHAFITGGASGIGLGIADALLKRGTQVTIADIDSESLAAVSAERSGKLFCKALDLRDREALAAAKSEAEAALGPTDILVANAAIGPDGMEIADIKPDNFERVMAINVGGIFNTLSVFGGDMRARRQGHILVTGSMAGLATGQVPGIGAYAASKFAVVALGEVLRGEMAPYDVGVSILVPGMVTTNLGRNTRKLGNEAQPIKVGSGPGAPMAAMLPAEVGEIAVEGIAQNKAYIITHPGDWPAVESRWRALQNAFSAS
jgi:NAD(P)-dependent dehydrogenase (short-subunit alcohol dehydrogenase family)